MVKFISYDGKYPNLCSGILTLLIDNKIVKFGQSYRFTEEEQNEYYNSFWYSSGFPHLNFEDDRFGEKYPWSFNEDQFPDKYLNYYDEICELFNENVAWGCCGGCL